MPSATTVPRRRRRDEDEEDDNGSAASSSSATTRGLSPASQTSAPGIKRLRLSNATASTGEDSGGEEDSNNEDEENGSESEESGSNTDGASQVGANAPASIPHSATVSRKGSSAQASRTHSVAVNQSDTGARTSQASTSSSKRRRLSNTVESRHSEEQSSGDNEEESGNEDEEDEENGSKYEAPASNFEGASEDGTGAQTSQANSARASQSGTNTQLSTSNSTRGGQNGGQSGVTQEGYKPGAILRIKVTDFVTYTEAEFYPGPKLNMVIGPNGTGKSTLVCAICLGLGWGPQHLGRAKDPGEFVKHGCREAHIEIELAKGPKQRQNPVVGRTIKRDGNKSTFSLNGKSASRQEVLNLARSFAIQIDNLCQFLPQDKVSEFAALTPIELLASTQRAAAGAEMTEWHDNLKSLRAEQKKLLGENTGDRELLTNLEGRQEMQRADVERMRERALIKRKIEMLETLRPVIKYREVHGNFKEMQSQAKDIEKELNDLKIELEPALRAVTEKQQYCVRLDDFIERQQRGVDQADSAATALGKKIEQNEDKMKDLDRQIESEKKSGSKHRQDAQQIQQTINKLRRQLNDEPIDFDVDWYNEQIRERRLQVREIVEKATQMKEAQRPLVDTVTDRTNQVKQAEQQLQGLDSQSGRQEAKLKNASFDSFRAYKWIQENQDKFENEVFGPPIVTCSVKDPKLADAVEMLLARTDFTAFTVQSRNDFKTLQRALNINMKLHDISIKTSTAPLENFTNPLTKDELKQLGFSGWAIDYLEGPGAVLANLCSENRMHQTPISLGDISEEAYNKMAEGPLGSWVAGKQHYQVTRRREYGPSATSTRVRPVRPAKIWTSQPVDTSTKEAIIRNIQMLQDEVKEAKEKMEIDQAALTQLGRDKDRLEQERIELEREKSDKQTALTNHRAIPERIRQQEAKQKTVQAGFEEIRTRVLNIRGQQDQISIQKAEAAIEYASAVADLRVLYEELIKLKVRRVECISDLDYLKERNAHHRQTLEAKREELKTAQDEIKAMTDTVKELSKEAQKIVKASKNQPDIVELIPTLVEHTVDQLEADIDSEKARLDLTQGGSNYIIKEFEERERQIKKLQERLTKFEEQLREYEHAIQEIRSKWEPKLDALVSNISDAFGDSFARIGCAGQVSLYKGEDETNTNTEEGQPSSSSGGTDFDQWSIQIHVKFRENASLQLLDSHRQSGGERAVSTIFYLMALQSLSASPFRVVDEINQGMDPRNERMVHERLVDIACAPTTKDGGGGQYFLITPKLLSGLVYKPGMRVLCIVSGEHMPKDYHELDFRGAVQRMRAVRSKKKGKGRAIEANLHRGGGVEAAG
ncbi:structural maintenance of chromosomes 5 smc5 [Aspergillus taichungensis]|uniref:Structural maintenance of chromosomes protein 5 n=1 Tax=Aspergillus taichungensis TaxID=482145 RepID=A0A2J5I8D7_9EURO|nr:structural maintenance of chromosomes 5 smc5 [Aspergillus taichungensis]